MSTLEHKRRRRFLARTSRPQPAQTKRVVEPGRVVDAPDGKPAIDYESDEIIAAACNYLCEGHSPSQIAKLIEVKFGVEMRRETPYKLIQQAARRQWLRFVAPAAGKLGGEIRRRYPFLERADVVTTLLANDVAEHTAELVLELICQLQRPPTSKKVIHLGFAGGYSMQRVVRKLADLLKEQSHDLPRKLVFHSLVGGFDVDIPGTAPNAFLALFDDPLIQAVVETQFVLLHAPPIVHPNQRAGLLELPSIHEAYESVRAGLDIILTSAGSIADKDSVLRRAHSKHRERMDEMMRQDGCVGDMLWLPLSKDKPLDNGRFPYRAMTLLELTELPDLISRGTKVVLSLGPCGRCNRLKTDVLTNILNLPTPLLTHLVVDSRTTRHLLGM